MWMVYVFRWWTKFCFKYDWVSVKNVCLFRLLSCDIRSVDTTLTKIIYNYINPNKTVQKSVVTKETAFMASSNILFHLSQGYKIFNSRFTFKPLINNNQQFLICILRPFKGLFLRSTALIEPRCIPLLWCVGHHYLHQQQLRYHTCWSHRGVLQCQNRYGSHSCCSRSRCFQGYQSLL